jgi:hypothetical protein
MCKCWYMTFEERVQEVCSKYLATRLDPENVLWLGDSFGDVYWPKSVHGKTIYSPRWQLQYTEQEYSNLNEKESPSRRSSSSLNNSCVSESEGGETGEQAELAANWQWPDDCGYESDGIVAGEHIPWLDAALDHDAIQWTGKNVEEVQQSRDAHLKNIGIQSTAESQTRQLPFVFA